MSRQPEYGRRDQFLDPQSFDARKAAELAERLESLHSSDAEQSMRAAYLDLLGVGPGQEVLEVGCGNGWVLREIARRVGRGGRAVGVDPSGELLALARRHLADTEAAVELHEADARMLPFRTPEFDTAVAALVLLHVPSAEDAVRELVRVVRPRGRIGIFERDNESFIVNHPDRELTRRIIQVGTDQTAVNAWVGRRLPGLLAAAGLSGVGIRPFTIFERQMDGAAVRYILRWADVAAELGTITADERTRWLADLTAQDGAGGFLCGVTYLFIWGTV